MFIRLNNQIINAEYIKSMTLKQNTITVFYKQNGAGIYPITAFEYHDEDAAEREFANAHYRMIAQG